MTTLQTRNAIQAALRNTGVNQKLAFVAYDTCLMGGMECLGDFADVTDVFIANPELDYGDGWNYQAALATLKGTPSMAPLEFARREVESWKSVHRKVMDQLYAVHAAYDLTRYSQLEARFLAFASALIANLGSEAPALASARHGGIHYSTGFTEVGQTTDFVERHG